MKLNTLSLSLLVSAALVVPTLAMADSTDYSQAAADVGTMPSETMPADNMPAEGSIQEGSGDVLTTQPSLDNGNGYETETIDETGTMSPQGNLEAYPPATAPADSDYAAPVEPEASMVDDNF